MPWANTTAGERLQFLADHHDVSLRELSKGAGRSPTHAEQLVNQGQKGMRTSTSLGYARRWGVTIEWLTEGKGEPFDLSVRTVDPADLPDELRAIIARRAPPPSATQVEMALASYRSDGARRTEQEWEELLDFLKFTPSPKAIAPRVVRDDPTETRSSKKRTKRRRG